MAKEKLSSADRQAAQNERNVKLLDLGGRDARVVIANTFESKELISKFTRVDAISKKSREFVGNRLSIENFTEINAKFNKVVELLDEIIQLGSEKGLLFDPNALKFSTLRPKLEKMIEEGKASTVISRELNVDIKKVESWLRLLDSQKEKSVDITKPAEKATTKKEVKEPAEKAS